MRQIFVFGSNTEGRHGKGMALEAVKNHGAIYGRARGLQGDSYAIVTKDLRKGVRSIPLSSIQESVNELITFARLHPEMEFYVMNLGCGLAGYRPKEIEPMFGKSYPSNIKLHFNKQK